MNTIRIHIFGHSGDAYDATQCNEDIKNGDILLIPDEQVVGLADTWPVAVTDEAGHLHTLKGSFETYVHEFGKNAGQRVFTDEQINLARALARGLGYP